PAARAAIARADRLVRRLTALGSSVAAGPGRARRAGLTRVAELTRTTMHAQDEVADRLTMVAEDTASANAQKQAVLAVVGALITIACVGALVAGFVRRLRRLSAAVRARAAGDRTHDFDVGGSDELTVLARALDEQA